jgi:hypothetical protein
MYSAALVCFRYWHNLATKKKEGGSEANTYYKFLKKKTKKNRLFHLQIYIMLNTIFVCEISSFDAALYFLRHLIIS